MDIASHKTLSSYLPTENLTFT